MPSSVIRRWDYDEAAHRLDIEFVSGRLYSYHDVPESVVAGMRRVTSKGSYFNRRIRDHFRFSRRDEPDSADTRSSGERVAIEEPAMPQGDKSAYTDKQKRKAAHIEEGYEERGVSKKEAEARAWATVNKESGGGNKSGSGRGKPDTHVSSRKGGRKGGAASANRSAAERSAAAKKGWETRRKRAAH